MRRLDGNSRTDTEVVRAATGCLQHLCLQHPSGEWVYYTHGQMASVLAVYHYCNLPFVVIPKPCPTCVEEAKEAPYAVWG